MTVKYNNSYCLVTTFTNTASTFISVYIQINLALECKSILGLIREQMEVLMTLHYNLVNKKLLIHTWKFMQ